METPGKQFEWSVANVKLHKTREAWERRFGGRTKFVGFNLPQLRSSSGRVVCPFAGDCAQVCYAAQGSYFMPHVKAMYERNFEEVRSSRARLDEDLLAELEGPLRRVTHVRLHDSGDFFAPWYYRAWLAVARARPQVIFYGYTKSLPIIDLDDLPDNLRLSQSVGGTRDNLIDYNRSHSRIFASGFDRRAAGYTNGNLDDLPVLLREVRIGLVYHGSKILSPQHLVLLRAHA